MAVELEGGGVDGSCPEGRKVDFQASAACQPRTHHHWLDLPKLYTTQ